MRMKRFYGAESRDGVNVKCVKSEALSSAKATRRSSLSVNHSGVRLHAHSPGNARPHCGQG